MVKVKSGRTERFISDVSPLPISLVVNSRPQDDVGDNNDSLSQIRFRYRYGLRTAKWKGQVDEWRFAKIPVVSIDKLDDCRRPEIIGASTSLSLLPPPPPTKGFLRRDGTLVIVTVSGNVYPTDLELQRRRENITFGQNVMSPDNCFKTRPYEKTNNRVNSYHSSIPSNNDHDDGDNGDDYNDADDTGDDRHTSNAIGHINGDIDKGRDNNINDDNGDDDGESSWDEESDDESTSAPPEGLDLTRVELIGACPYCNQSFVGRNGRVLYSILRRLTPGDESEFVEEHIDRCCIRQHTGELVKCTDCDKSFHKTARKERNHWRKYHPSSWQKPCPFEQCSETILRSEEALFKHLTSKHYWSQAKTKAYVQSTCAGNVAGFKKK